MDWRQHIERSSKVMLGKPVIRGTRITAKLILEMMAEGATTEDILQSYPHLGREQVRAALVYATESLATDEVVLLDERSV